MVLTVLATEGISASDRATTSASGADKMVNVCLLDFQTIKDALPLVSSTNRIKMPLLLRPLGANDASQYV